MKALLASIIDQLDDTIARLLISVKPQEYMFKNPDRKVYEQPDEPGYPREYHESLIEVSDLSDGYPKWIGVRWWPELDELCALRRRVQNYHGQL